MTSSKRPGPANWFMENNLVIARLDKLSRNEDVQAKLTVKDGRWDLVVCDEAHRCRRPISAARSTIRNATARTASLDDHTAFSADDGNAAQWEGSRLPVVHGAARW